MKLPDFRWYYKVTVTKTLMVVAQKHIQIKGTVWSEVKITQLYPSLCYPMNYTVQRSLQARILDWVAFPFSRGSSQPRDWTQVSHIADGFFTSWATREAQKKNPCTHSLLVFNKEERLFNGEKTVSSISDPGKTVLLNIKVKLEHCLKPHTKINSQRIRGLKIRLDTIKLLEGNIGRTLFSINHSKIFFDPPPGVMKIKAKINGT